MTCVAVTVENLREALCWSPINLRHIDSCHQLSTYPREVCCVLCEGEHIGNGVDLEPVAIQVVRLKLNLCELTNNTYSDRLVRRVELESHLLRVSSVQSDRNVAIVACRNCYINRSCLCAESQALAEGYRYGVRCVSVSSQNSCCAINVEVTCENAVLCADGCVGEHLAITLNVEAQNARKVVELNSGALSLSEAIHCSNARSESTCGVRLHSSKSYNLSTLSLSNYACSRCRVNCVERINKLRVELKVGIGSLSANARQRDRRLAIDSDSIALAPVERIDAISLLAELGTSLLQRCGYGSLNLGTCVNAKILGRVCCARKCEHTRYNRHENFCQIFHRFFLVFD